MVASSAGGHWMQMRRLLPAFEGCEMVYVGVEPALDPDLGPGALLPHPQRQPGAIPSASPSYVWQVARDPRARAARRGGVDRGRAGLFGLVVAKGMAGSRPIWIDSHREQSSGCRCPGGGAAGSPTPG